MQQVEDALALDNKSLADATNEEVDVVVQSFDSQRSQTHQLNSHKQRIGSLLGAGGVQQVEDALARGGKSLANVTDQELNVIIKKLRSTCPGRKAYKTMSAEEESQLNEKISSRHQESLKRYDECSGNEFIEETGEWKDRTTSRWSMEEINIIMDAEGDWNTKNICTINLHEGLKAGVQAKLVHGFVSIRKSGWPNAIEWLCRSVCPLYITYASYCLLGSIAGSAAMY